MEETTKAMLTPKYLVVLGNGFDLSCNLKSSYKDFLRKILTSKLNIEDLTLESNDEKFFEYYSDRLKEFVNKKNFFNNEYRCIEEEITETDLSIINLNPWYIIFIYKKLSHDSDWFLVEEQIAEELSKNHIVEKIGNTLFNIGVHRPKEYYEKLKKQDSFYTNTTFESVEKIYEVLSYSLLHKNLDSLRLNESKEIYQKLREQLKKLQDEYPSKECSPNCQELSPFIEEKNKNTLFKFVSQVLLTEVKEVEMDFDNYLIEMVNDMSQTKYCKSASNLMERILESASYNYNDNDNIFNILSFNYTQPWCDSGRNVYGDKIFKKKASYINIHGIISGCFELLPLGIDSEYSGIVFGVDDEKISPLSPEYIFTKSSRTLDLNTNLDNVLNVLNNRFRKRFSDLLNPSIENVIFFGHSLSKADYSYFKMIFDTYIDQKTCFTFVYQVFEGTTDTNERRKLIQNISALFGKYSIDKTQNTDIFKMLIQNNRIRIEPLKAQL